MPWSILILSSLLEAFIPILIIKSESFTHLLYTPVLAVVVTGSVFGLRYAMKSISLSVAYIIWTALGIVGTVLVGSIVLNETISLTKIGCILLMVVAVVGLRISSIETAENRTVPDASY